LAEVERPGAKGSTRGAAHKIESSTKAGENASLLQRRRDFTPPKKSNGARPPWWGQ